MPAMPDSQHYHYHACLLRLWQADASSPWRASLVNAHNRETHYFSTLGELVDFLYRLTSVQPAAAENTNHNPYIQE